MGLAADRLYVYDPQGAVTAYLTANAMPFTPLTTLAPPPAGKIWLIGRDALTPADSTSAAFSAYALTGGRVIIMEQTNPLKYQGLNPAEAISDRNLGRTAFVEDLTHPIMAGLDSKDFFTWEPGEVVYRNAYRKPSRGAKSLLQCHPSLTHSGLMVIPVGDGVMTLCQVVAGEKLTTNATARTLFTNMLNFSVN